MNDDAVPESVAILHKGFDETGTLAITCDGKNYHFKLNRRQIMQVCAGGYVAMANMEPGPWRRAHMEAA